MRLTAHFHSEEFACHDGTPVPPELLQNLQLVAQLCQSIRDVWTGPLTVLSGYRTPDYNTRIGGAKASQHMHARAADLRPAYLGDVSLSDRVKRLHSLVLSEYEAGRMPTLGGLGLYPGWIHVDTFKAPDGHLRRWTGGGVGSEQ